MLPLIIQAERKGRIKPVFLFAIALLLAAELGLFLMPVSVLGIGVLLFVFFTAFNLLEATLPSLISRVAPVDCRGTAMGVYSSSQFFGAFLGGTLGGVLHGRFGLHAVFIVAAAGALVWLLLALSMRPPEKLSSYIYRLDAGFDGDTTGLSRRLAGMAGVAEAVVVPEEGVAYLKVDRQVFDAASLP
jgi:MFS family permease